MRKQGAPPRYVTVKGPLSDNYHFQTTLGGGNMCSAHPSAEWTDTSAEREAGTVGQQKEESSPQGAATGRPREEGSADMSQLVSPCDEGSNPSCAETGHEEEGGCECGSSPCWESVSRDRRKAE